MRLLAPVGSTAVGVPCTLPTLPAMPPILVTLGQFAITTASPAGLTVSMTVTLFAAAPVAVIWIVAVYVPVARPTFTARSVRAAGAVVTLNDEVDSHPEGPASYATVNASPLSVPAPPLVTFTTWPPGLLPSDALNATVAGVATIDAAAPTVSVTVTSCGEFATPADVTGTVAVYVPA